MQSFINVFPSFLTNILFYFKIQERILLIVFIIMFVPSRLSKSLSIHFWIGADQVPQFGST